MSGSRDENVFMARLAEQAERYDDMVEYVRRVATLGQDLTLDERNLFSVAYKNSVGMRRSAWRAIYSYEQKDPSRPAEATALIAGYRAKVETELAATCGEVLQILQTNLIGSAAGEARVFYLKMRGDYHRYRSEFASGDQRSGCAQEAHDAYQEASEAAKELAATHPIRLGLALNFSVFYYEVFASPDKACALAKASFDEAVVLVDSLDEESQREASSILQLLRDNLMLWTSAGGGGDRAPEVDGTAVEDL